MGQLVTDELGQAFQVEEKNPAAMSGHECILASIKTVEAIAEFLSTSLGPTGMDKMLKDEYGNITMTNDGATILKEMKLMSNPIAQLVQELSQAQDDASGDGTTSVVILAAALLRQAQLLLERGMHPIRISAGYAAALNTALERLRAISMPVDNLRTCMLKAARTSLESKLTGMGALAELCVDAVLAVADHERKDADMDRIYIQTLSGRSVQDTALVRGIVLKKEVSHVQMPREKQGARVALLSCPFEPPRLKNKNTLLVQTAEEYRALAAYEREQFEEMIAAVKRTGADVVLCQWGFDDEANSMLAAAGLMAVRWVGGHELGMLAAHLNASITARFESLENAVLGTANVREDALFTESERLIVVERAGTGAGLDCVTLLVRGSSEYTISEAKRALWDALCAVRNVLADNAVVAGGGSAELSAAIALTAPAESRDAASVEYAECAKAFARALLEIPLTLARNSGFDAAAYVERLREQQISTGESALGVDCHEAGESNMRTAGVFEALQSKIRQFKMATELVGMILKVHDIVPSKSARRE